MKATGPKSSRLKSLVEWPGWHELQKLFKATSQNFIGLDFGASSIKLVHLVNKGEGLRLVNFEMREVGGTEERGATEEELLAFLRDMLKRVSLRGAKVIVSLNCPGTGLRILSLPPIPKGEVRQAVQLEAKEHFPFPLEDSEFDFEFLGSASEQGIEKRRMSVVVSPKKTVERVLAVLNKAGVRPVSVIPCSKAIEQLAKVSAVEKPDLARCWLDIGARQSELLILKGRRLIFTRKIPLAGQDFTRAMTTALMTDRGRIELSWTEAEKIKRQVGLPQEAESRMIAEKFSAAQMSSMLRSPLEHLVSEIHHCFDYYQEEAKGEKIESLTLFGRGSCLKGIGSYLAEALDIEVKVGNPLRETRIEAQIVLPEDGFSQYAAALGAALTMGEGANLLPRQMKDELRRQVQRATLETAAVAGVLMLVFFYVGLGIQRTNLGKRIAVARLELSGLEIELGEAKKYQWVRGQLASQPYWEDVLKELSHIVPEGVMLTDLVADAPSQRITLKGLIRSTDREGVLSQFMKELEEGLFNKVKLIKAGEKAGQGTSEFEVECWVDQMA